MLGVVCAVSFLGVDWSTLGRPGIDFVPNEVIVGLRPEAELAGNAWLTAFGQVEALGGGAFRIQLGDGRTIRATVDALRQSPLATFAEPNYLAQTAFTPNDPALSSQYGIKQTQTDLAWDYEQGADAVVVAVVDTGVDARHPEFGNRVLGGYDFVNNDANPMDDNGHGTLCAGIVAAEANNGRGIAGVAFGCRVLPVKVLKQNGTGSYSTIAKGIRWAADQGADVINLSLAGTSSSGTLAAAVNYALNKGCVVVAAAGNDGKKNRKVYPASCPGVISVAANDRRNNRLSISNYGLGIDVSAPGDAIYSTYPNNSYRTVKGTSMSSAFVSGQAALLKSYLGAATLPSSIRSRIRASATPAGTWVSSGIVNVGRSVRGEAP